MNDKFLNNMAINVQEGRLPENDGELAISARINEKFKTNYKVGDTITLNIGELKGTSENKNANYYDEEQIKKQMKQNKWLKMKLLTQLQKRIK